MNKQRDINDAFYIDKDNKQIKIRQDKDLPLKLTDIRSISIIEAHKDLEINFTIYPLSNYTIDKTDFIKNTKKFSTQQQPPPSGSIRFKDITDDIKFVKSDDTNILATGKTTVAKGELFILSSKTQLGDIQYELKYNVNIT